MLSLPDPKVTFRGVADYLSQQDFDLYIVNDYTKHLAKTRFNVLEVARADRHDLDTFLRDFKQKNARIVAIGAGTVVDVVKYICHKTNSTFCFIPSALSTNSFATHRNSFFDSEHGKLSSNSVVASEIVVDFDLLEQAYILNKFGIVEVAATATAQVDCDIAVERHREVFDSALRGRAQKLAQRSLDLLSQPFTREALKELLDCLLESGSLTRLQGSGRLVSGSEHIISSYIESEKACPHGMGLLFGILVTQQLQVQAGYGNAITDTIVEYLKKDVDMHEYIQENTTADQIVSVLGRVRPRDDKFTVLDIVSREELLHAGDKVVKSYFQKV